MKIDQNSDENPYEKLSAYGLKDLDQSEATNTICLFTLYLIRLKVFHQTATYLLFFC